MRYASAISENGGAPGFRDGSELTTALLRRCIEGCLLSLVYCFRKASIGERGRWYCVLDGPEGFSGWCWMFLRVWAWKHLLQIHIGGCEGFLRCNALLPVVSI